MNRPKTIDGTPVITSTKYRTPVANGALFPNSTRYRATPMPNGMAIAEASATISMVPRIALERRPWSPRKFARSGRS